jgi:hypothetical protein
MQKKMPLWCRLFDMWEGWPPSPSMMTRKNSPRFMPKARLSSAPAAFSVVLKRIIVRIDTRSVSGDCRLQSDVIQSLAKVWAITGSRIGLFVAAVNTLQQGSARGIQEQKGFEASCTGAPLAAAAPARQTEDKDSSPALRPD